LIHSLSVDGRTKFLGADVGKSIT